MEKETIIHLRVSKVDKEKIMDRAKGVSLSLSEYTRKMLLDGQITFIAPGEMRTINGLANNLNQLTRQANTTGTIPGEVVEILESMIKHLRHAYRQR